MANWRRPGPGVYVAHSKRVPRPRTRRRAAAASPSWRGRRREPRRPASPSGSKTIARTAARSSPGSAPAPRAPTHLRELAARGPTFEELGDEWLDGVERGRIGRRRGRGKPYSETTIASYAPLAGATRAAPGVRATARRRDHRDRVAAWIDQLSPRGPVALAHRQPSRSRSAIYAWAPRPAAGSSRATRCAWSSCRRTTRSRACASRLAPEAAALLAALEPEDRLPYAIAFYAGLRRVGDLPARMARRRSTATASPRASSSAGPRARPARDRRPPIAEPPARDPARRAGSARAARARARSSSAR